MPFPTREVAQTRVPGESMDSRGPKGSTNQALLHTVNIYSYKTIEANGNTGVIPTTSKSFSLYRELLKPLWVIYQKMLIYLYG